MTVILLKNRSDDADLNRPDPYERACSECRFVSIMGYRNINLQDTKQVLERTGDYDGIVITSQRAVDAVKQVLPELPSNVYSKPVYTVGPTTASRLEILGFKSIIGAGTGNGIALAELMVGTLPPNSRLLFLAGEIHRRQLPNRLTDAGHSVDTKIVYCTEPDLSVSTVLENTVRPGDWIVFFSPSHTERVLEFIKTKGDVKVAAIGPTTKEFLESRGFKVDATASDPSAEGLMRAIYNV